MESSPPVILFSVPYNFDPIRQQGIDIMHLEETGLLQAHMKLLGLTEEFQKISAQTKTYSRQLGSAASSFEAVSAVGTV